MPIVGREVVVQPHRPEEEQDADGDQAGGRRTRAPSRPIRAMVNALAIAPGGSPARCPRPNSPAGSGGRPAARRRWRRARSRGPPRRRRPPRAGGCARMRRFTIGSAVRSSCQTNAVRPTAAATASTRISRDSNQSLLSPRSSRIWSAPMPTIRSASPSQSTRVRRTDAPAPAPMRQVSTRGQDAERHVDVEDPGPRVVVGDPSAERRPERRPDHDAHAEDGHGGAALAQREDVEQDRLRRADERAAADALDHAPEHQRPRASGRAPQKNEASVKRRIEPV